jgi:hypothetical protein
MSAKMMKSSRKHKKRDDGFVRRYDGDESSSSSLRCSPFASRF